MCFHSRLIHGCGHYQWGGVFVRCSTERRFDKGELDEGCSAMWSHGFRTIGTVAQCPKCVKAKAKTDDKLAAIKAQLRALKTSIGARPTKKSEGEADTPAESDPATVATAGVESPFAVASSYPTPDEDNNVEDDEDDEVNEVMEEIKYLYSEVSYGSVPEHPVPEHPDPEHRPLKLVRDVVLARGPAISQSTRRGRRWVSG
ncbi:hypothetical protein B0T18DRAFT_74884 [Schizothecium vesticola]|uniref:Uncharacterized protein n=1 Tax=Schizothecium vesticola TaxID=314040 RepID=A0AA40F6E6_9PEZI|nr:hypothetical protein B0T18DRAFT_74884 [Schizothecium vesticola]